jgi:hypothetical protein
MGARARGHQRPEKILVAMNELSHGTSKSLKYEEIVVKAFEMFPDDFALRGYPQYPDSSDIHKPLYGPLKRNGFVQSANKTFRLTPRGVDAAMQLLAGTSPKGNGKSAATGERIPRDLQREIDRILATEAFQLYFNEQSEGLLDTDFYAFVNCTVRTKANDFIGRMSVTDEAIAAATKARYPNPEAAKALAEAWEYLKLSFKDIISRKQARK